MIFEANYSLADEAFSRDLRPVLDAHVPASIRGEVHIKNNCGPQRVCTPDLQLKANV